VLPSEFGAGKKWLRFKTTDRVFRRAQLVFLGPVRRLFLGNRPPCWANLGDTLEQSVARYGKPIAQGKGDSTDAGYPWYTFNYGKFEIEETFTLSGKKCWMELWWKKDRSPMSESDQLAILTENANAEKWGNTKEGVEGIRSWIRTDGATAQYDPMRGNNTVGNEMLLAITQKDTDPSHR
jgi:hypothetical protein